MKLLTLSVILVVACSAGATAQLDYASQMHVDLHTRLEAMSTREDTISPSVARRLLPQDMSIMEKGLWGEDGILRTTGIASPLTPESRKSELHLRRAMLTAHQVGGFLTVASMIATVYYGQKSLLDPNSGQRSDPYRRPHQLFETTTIVLYSATGALAIFSPPPLIRRSEFNTVTVHKTLAWIHFLGMVVTPILGGTVLKRGPIGRYVDLNQAKFHQISGYVTAGALAASMIVVTF